MWNWRRRQQRDPRKEQNGFPQEFKVQRIGMKPASVLMLPPAGIAEYFQDSLPTAERLLLESYDKRYVPSTFIEKVDGGFRVGWFSARYEYECVREFSKLADAATDYVLFSLGKGRWTPPAHGPTPTR
jgi:hypothetical protein